MPSRPTSTQLSSEDARLLIKAIEAVEKEEAAEEERLRQAQQPESQPLAGSKDGRA